LSLHDALPISIATPFIPDCPWQKKSLATTAAPLVPNKRRVVSLVSRTERPRHLSVKNIAPSGANARSQGDCSPATTTSRSSSGTSDDGGGGSAVGGSSGGGSGGSSGGGGSGGGDCEGGGVDGCEPPLLPPPPQPNTRSALNDAITIRTRLSRYMVASGAEIDTSLTPRDGERMRLL